MNARTISKRLLMILAVGTIGLAYTVKMSAQVQTRSTTTPGEASQQVRVDNAEVILVEGNDVVLRMSDGSIRHVSNVPESARATVDGREIGIHDLKPGMHLQKTITTTTTPKVITTTQTVSGRVWHVTPPNSVILTLENGQNQSFKIPAGQKFKVNGQMVDAWGLKKGMNVFVTKVVEQPITEVEEQARLTGRMPEPPPAPQAETPMLIAVAAPVPAPVAEAAPETLPKTGSELPLITLLGFLSLAGSGGVKLFRKIR